MDWAALTAYAKGPRTTAIGRAPSVQAAYDAFRSSHGDALNAAVTKRFITAMPTTASVTFARNDFPYAVAANIVHLTAWARDNTVDWAGVISKVFDQETVVWFGNHAKLQSVGLPHVHVFVLDPGNLPQNAFFA